MLPMRGVRKKGKFIKAKMLCDHSLITRRKQLGRTSMERDLTGAVLGKRTGC